MKFALALSALLAGALAGELLSKSPPIHRLALHVFRRGELVAMVNGRGIADADDVADAVLRASATHLPVNRAEFQRTVDALRDQFGSERNFAAACRADGIWKWQLREMVRDMIRGERWLEDRLAGEARPAADEVRRYFEQHQGEFAQPLRIRARHIFLAAPAGSANVEAKRAAMQEIIARLNHGEDFATMAGAVAEDEATKRQGGDLGFFASNRVPAEFWTAIEKLPVNAPPVLVQSHLGFHAVQIMDVRAPRVMSLDEAAPEIEQLLAAQKRGQSVGLMREQLEKQAILVSR